jgi:ribosomal protein S1
MIVDIGYKSDAIVLPMNRANDPGRTPVIPPGTGGLRLVLDSGDKDSVLLVSLAKAAQKGDWNNARKLMEDAERVELEVVDINKAASC